MTRDDKLERSIGSVMRDVLAERLIQEQKWGVQNHRQIVWLAILAEEFGEAAKEVNELHFRTPGGTCPLDQDKIIALSDRQAALRKELIQTAAVAVAMIESLDRNGR